MDVRFFFHQAHYRSFQDFTWEALDAASRARKNLSKKVQQLELSDDMRRDLEEVKSVYDLIDGDETQGFLFGLLEGLFDDLQMPQVLARIQE